MCKTIWITGASGFIGNKLVDYLGQSNDKIIALVRQPEKYKSHSVSSNISYHSFDLLDPEQWLNSLPKPDCIIHCAYQPFNNTNKNASVVNYNATKSLVEYARNNGKARFIYLSTQSAHSDAKSVYGKSKLEIENILNQPNEYVLKLGLVLGNGQGLSTKIKSLLNKSKFIPLIGGGKQPIHYIADTDLLSIVDQIVKNRDVNNVQLYHVANPNAITIKSLYEYMSRKIGKSNIFLSLPYWIFDILFYCLELLPINLPVNRENLLGLKCLKYFNNEEHSYYPYLYKSIDEIEL